MPRWAAASESPRRAAARTAPPPSRARTRRRREPDCATARVQVSNRRSSITLLSIATAIGRRDTDEPAPNGAGVVLRIARFGIVEVAVTAPRVARGSTLPRRDAATIAAHDRHLVQAADEPIITRVGIIPTPIAGTAFPRATRGLARNTCPRVVATTGTDEPGIARVVQRAAGEASWVTVQLAGAAPGGARGRRQVNAVARVIAAQPTAAAAVPSAAVPFIGTAAIVIGVGVVIAGERGISPHALNAGPAGIARTSIGRPVRAISTHVPISTTGIGNRRAAVGGRRDIRGVGDGTAGNTDVAPGIADADGVANIAATIDIADGDRAALRIRAGEPTVTSTCKPITAAEAADARGQATAGFVEATAVPLVGTAVQIAVIVESVPRADERRIGPQALTIGA